MTTKKLPSGTVECREYGPESSEYPPVLFVHGVLVDMRLWGRVAEALGTAGHQCITVTWPLGSHRIPWGAAAHRGPHGAARLVAEFIADQGLEGCTLVGNDSGGAICQYLLHERPELVGRLVLTNCDAFSTFPPQPFAAVFALLARATLTGPLLGAMRLRALRHSPLGFGLLLRRPDADLTASWAEPARTDPAIRADLTAFLRAIDPSELARITPTMADFRGPVTLVWGTADRCFTPALGRRLAAAFGDDRPGGVRFVEVDGARTFVALDEPQAVAQAITDIASVPGSTMET